MAYPLREPCKACGATTGRVEHRNGQDVAYCGLGHYAYCVPRSESGREVRSVRTRPSISPSQRARILQRDGGRCVLCGTTDGPMHVGHLLSVDVGRQLGATDEELYSDENLAAMCAECNLGLGRTPVPARLLLRVILGRLAAAAVAPVVLLVRALSR